jgi:hypothetical protein
MEKIGMIGHRCQCSISMAPGDKIAGGQKTEILHTRVGLVHTVQHSTM